VRDQFKELQATYGDLPICVAKTQYSFSTIPTCAALRAATWCRSAKVRLSAGAGFLVVICGEIMTMPGLPKSAVGGEDPSRCGRPHRGLF
jgi:formate--tetrahydrofolate ligase